MIRLMFLVNSLNRGGAERQLTLLAREIDRTRFAVTVVTISDGGALRSEIEQIEGIRVISLHRRRRSDAPLCLWRFARVLRQLRPDIVHGYLDVANVLSLLFGKPAGAKVVWGVRASNVDFSLYDRRTAWYFGLAAQLSRFADLIVANSQAGKRHHTAQGFAAEKLIVIPNGFDTERFRPDAAAGQRVRSEWGVSGNERLIGLVARLDPIKDHPTFLRAAARLARGERNVRFVCIGDGREDYRQSLQALAEELGVNERLIWAGELADTPAAHNALDIATSASTSEGFSNTIGEAMACGVPCVVTDVGDSALLVGATGIAVPPGDPCAMSAAWARLLNESDARRDERSRAARQRIVSEYSLSALAKKTAAALANLVSDES